MSNKKWRYGLFLILAFIVLTLSIDARELSENHHLKSRTGNRLRQPATGLPLNLPSGTTIASNCGQSADLVGDPQTAPDPVTEDRIWMEDSIPQGVESIRPAPSILPLQVQALNKGVDRFSSDSIREGWVRRYVGVNFIYENEVETSVLDSSGNVYVAGSSNGAGSWMDYVTVKYDPAGNKLWESRYYGLGDSMDYVRDMVLDASGNVYVTGTSYGLGTGFDYATVKYDSTGKQIWVARYNGSGNGDDQATALAIDSIGNIYVTGGSQKLDESYDYTTIKYTPNGEQEWTVFYNGSGNSWDCAVALAVDSSGAIYVTGTSWGVGASYDYATLKYSPMGELLWTTCYNGPGNGSDNAIALAVDPTGQVYVTGTSSDSGSLGDFCTLKYSSAGEILWEARYNGPRNDADQVAALALDKSGNVYIAGTSHSLADSSDYVTIKYAPTGERLWESRYHGPDVDINQAVALSVDLSGNVYVTGSSIISDKKSDYATIKYNSNGEQLWTVNYTSEYVPSNVARAMVIDLSGNIYVTGKSSGYYSYVYFTTVKYDSAGIQQWTVNYNRPPTTIMYTGANAIDATGNVYVMGGRYGSTSHSHDYALIKYDPAGELLWKTSYNGPADSADYAMDMVLDRFGNAYITGLSIGIGSQNDYATLKYSPTGELLWTARYNGPENSEDNARALALDVSGNVYVTGSSYNSATGFDYVTVKYSPTGEQLWEVSYNGPGDSTDYPFTILVDDSSYVYVSGRSGGSGTGFDYATIKYAPTGEQIWTARYNGPGNQYDQSTAMTVDSVGQVYVTGHSIGLESGYDYATVKYSPSGEQLWVARYNGPVNGNDLSLAIAVNSSGEVYVSGNSIGSDKPSNYDYATLKYSSTGEQLWAIRYNGLGDSSDVVGGMVLDRSGNIYVSGASTGSTTLEDCVTFKYSPTGELLSSACYQVRNKGQSGSGSIKSINLDPSGNIYVTGSYRNSMGLFMLTIKYEQMQVSVDKSDPISSASFALDPNYPNPFNPVTTISFTLPFTSFTSLKIYDLTGREISTLISKDLVSGKYTVEWMAEGLSSGVYLCRLQAGVWVETKKITLLK